MIIRKLSPEEWAAFSATAHLILFNENRPAEMERISFTLVTETPEGIPASYAACREVDSETLYYQHGGVFPNIRGKRESQAHFDAIAEYVLERYKRVTCLIKNTNAPAMIVVLKNGFIPMGIRYFDGEIYSEFLKKRST